MVVMAALCAACGACGDNLSGNAPDVEPATALFVTAHLDDDMIFMQPELMDALSRGSSTTIYVTSGDPRGHDHARKRFHAAMAAYRRVTGTRDWHCGHLEINGLAFHHCRLLERGISLIALDVPDGGRHGEMPDNLVHLVEQSETSLPLHGERGGRITSSQLIAELVALIEATAPAELHVLDFTGTHGDDHPDHMMAASFALWAVARSHYRGPIIAHRGYNVEVEPPTLSDDDYARAQPMLGAFEACYAGCGPCGTVCSVLDRAHDTWLRRQYSTRLDYPTGRLAAQDAPGRCLVVRDGAAVLDDCASPDAVMLDATGHLRAGAVCLTSGLGNDDPLVVTACDDAPGQLWLSDGEGGVWNGRPPAAIVDMTFDHTRCLASDPVAAPVCGSRRAPRWVVMPN